VEALLRSLVGSKYQRCSRRPGRNRGQRIDGHRRAIAAAEDTGHAGHSGGLQGRVEWGRCCERKGKESVWAYLLFGYIVAMLANVFIPHIPASFEFRSYTPGVVTAVLINLPVMGFLSIRAVREGWVSGRKAVVFGVAVPLAIAAMIPMLFLITKMEAVQCT
jgi:hypothetical protein